MNFFTIGLVLDTAGKILLGITVLIVHRNVLHEHKIDKDVLFAVKKEQVVGLSAIVLIVVGSLLQGVYHTQ